jgi:hypothetical protein
MLLNILCKISGQIIKFPFVTVSAPLKIRAYNHLLIELSVALDGTNSVYE